MLSRVIRQVVQKKASEIISPGNPARHLSESSDSAAMFSSENGRKIERKILRLIFQPIVGIVYSEQTQEVQTCGNHGRWNIRNQSAALF